MSFAFVCSSIVFGQKRREIIRSGYYFVIQIEDLNCDTINFHTIEVYSLTPSVKISIGNDSTYTESVKSLKFINRSFNKGYLKGTKRSDIGKILVLNTTIDKVNDDGFVEFKHPIKLRKLKLCNLYKVRRE